MLCRGRNLHRDDGGCLRSPEYLGRRRIGLLSQSVLSADRSLLRAERRLHGHDRSGVRGPGGMDDTRRVQSKSVSAPNGILLRTLRHVHPNVPDGVRGAGDVDEIRRLRSEPLRATYGNVLFPRRHLHADDTSYLHVAERLERDGPQLLAEPVSRSDRGLLRFLRFMHPDLAGRVPHTGDVDDARRVQPQSVPPSNGLLLRRRRELLGDGAGRMCGLSDVDNMRGVRSEPMPAARRRVLRSRRVLCGDDAGELRGSARLAGRRRRLLAEPVL